jgi:hypothetical protein
LLDKFASFWWTGSKLRPLTKVVRGHLATVSPDVQHEIDWIILGDEPIDLVAVRIRDGDVVMDWAERPGWADL